MCKFPTAMAKFVVLPCSYWGDPVKWGPQNKKTSAEECCSDCLAYKPANEEDLECNGT